MKKLLIILFFITFTNNAYSDLKFDKDNNIVPYLEKIF